MVRLSFKYHCHYPTLARYALINPLSENGYPFERTSLKIVMIPLISLSGLVLLSILLHMFFIYPAFLSPLAKFPPAHLTSPFCTRWISSKQRNGKTGIHSILAAHKKYGPIIRPSPNKISVASLEGLRKVYLGASEKTT